MKKHTPTKMCIFHYLLSPPFQCVCRARMFSANTNRMVDRVTMDRMAENEHRSPPRWQKCIEL